MQPVINELIEKKSVTVEDTGHFSELCQEFDEKLGTKTSVTELTLREIWDHFMLLNRPNTRFHADEPEKYIHKIVHPKIEKLFHSSNAVLSSDPHVAADDIGRLNTIYLIKMDILSGTQITDPISVSLFENGSGPIHPGGTRLMFANCYHTKIPTMVTNYMPAVGGRFPGVEFYDPRYISFDFTKIRRMYFRTSTDDVGSARVFDKALNPDSVPGDDQTPAKLIKFVHQITDYNLMDSNRNFGHPKESVPPRIFEMNESRTKVSVNGMPILLKKNDLWEIFMEN